MFVAGDDNAAKATVADLLRSLGWRSILDLGGIEAARGMEMYVLHWVNVRMALGTNSFNIKVVQAF
jgi:predicted dinucleotide-binding enzyme